ncbi:MAG: ABC transporter permease subunit [Candidatus Aminicenantes bacterium]|nr:ABC transporter permease subunit [Candidatus Aminicenantes bacterium]
MKTTRRSWLPILILLAAAIPSRSAGQGAAEASVLDGLKDKRIGVLIGSTHDQFITSRFPGAEILRLDASPDLAVALKAGRCDVILMDSNTGRLYRRDDPGLGLLTEKIFAERIGFGFAEASLRDKFDAFLRDLRKSGELDRIRSKWNDDSGQTEIPEPPLTGPNGRLKIATSADLVPFTYLREGRRTGLDIELAYRFAERQGLLPEVQTLPFASLIAAVASGKADVICSCITITEERSKQVRFSEPYYESGADILALKTNMALGAGRVDAGDDGLPAVETAVIGAMTGTTGEQLVRERFPKADLKLFDDVMDAIAALKTGRLDYVITAYTTALRAANANDDLAVRSEEYNHEWASIAVRKDNPALLAEINAVLAEFKADGTLDKIIGHWVRPDGSPYEIIKVPQAEGGPPLRVAIAANREPMGFHQGEEIVGLDPELIQTIAFRLGRPVVFSDMKFSALIAALESGKADVICSNMTATDERRERVGFTDGYYVNPQVMLARQSIPAGSGRTGFFAGVKDSFFNNIVREKRYLLIWQGLKVTFLISILSALLGTVLGGLICFMRMSKRTLLRGIARAYIDLLRGIPQVVLLMIMFYVILAPLDISGVLVATFTFALNFAAYVSEMFRTSIESVKKGQTEAGIALGFSKAGAFLHIVLPQAVQRVLPVYKGEFIALVKMTAIVGYIAVQDLTKASDIIRSRTFDAFFPLVMVAVLYFVLAWILTRLLEAIQVRTAPRKGGAK